jgi:uncharacterized protein (DUF362 family)
MDHPFGGTAEKAYQISQIGDAVKAAGGQMVVMGSAKFRDTPIPEGKDIKKWLIYQDALKFDVLIDVPIAKHHGLARLTLAGKNLMGLTENRGGLHPNLGERLVDLYTLFRPRLIVVDAYRMLMNNGPTGGNLNDVKLAKTVIASHDIVAADAYATTLFGLPADAISYVKAGAARGIGIDIDPQRIKEANENLRAAGVGDRVKFLNQDLFETNFSEATVVTLYLLPSLNLKLRPKLLKELKPGTRIVSHAFDMDDWKPEQVIDVDGRTVYLWTVPKR